MCSLFLTQFTLRGYLSVIFAGPETALDEVEAMVTFFFITDNGLPALVKKSSRLSKYQLQNPPTTYPGRVAGSVLRFPLSLLDRRQSDRIGRCPRQTSFCVPRFPCCRKMRP